MSAPVGRCGAEAGVTRSPLLRGLGLVLDTGPVGFVLGWFARHAEPEREGLGFYGKTHSRFAPHYPHLHRRPSPPTGMESSSEKLRGLRITSLDEENDEAELAHEPPPAAAVDYEDEEEDDEEPEAVLGFLEKPKRPGLLLRHMFPSKAGGIPVRATTRSY
jgi:hypothetical protein